MTEEIVIAVGCDPNGCDAEQQMVLEYSLKKNSTIPYRIEWMKLSKDPNSFWYSDGDEGWNTKKWSTPFSGFRWAVPEFCDFRGKAIYCDADFIFLTDIKKLVEQEFTGNSIAMAKGGGSWRFCLTFWDNVKARNVMPSITQHRGIESLHQQLMSQFAQNTQLVQPFVGNWNCVDGEGMSIGEIDALHYSDMRTQFSHKYSVPRLESQNQNHWFDGEIKDHPRQDLVDLFDQYYSEAIESGMSVSDYTPNDRFGEISKQTQKGYTTAHFGKL